MNIDAFCYICRICIKVRDIKLELSNSKKRSTFQLPRFRIKIRNGPRMLLVIKYLEDNNEKQFSHSNKPII